MISVKVVEACPYTVAGTGVMRVSHDVLAILAGAIYDKDEWLALLVGTRSADGMDIAVTSLRIPQQERSHASCELAKPEPLAPDVVGVVHSHHSMGAFFSQTDVNTLNPRFPSSLVVAHVKAKSSEAEGLLGFSYQAEGCVSLPCGSLGTVGFTVIPSPAIPAWPMTVTPGFTEPSIHVGLYQCPHITRIQVGLEHHCKTSCNLETTESAKAIFGCNGTAFLLEVQEKTERKKWHQPYSGHNSVLPVNDKRHSNPAYNNYPRIGEYYNPFGDECDERMLRHWGI
jgi:proteasome lid subunit RPN8/RPN11